MNPDVSIEIDVKDSTGTGLTSVKKSVEGVRSSFQGLKDSLKSAEASFQSMRMKGAMVFGALAYGGDKAITAFSDLEESINAVSVVFEGGSEAILNFGKTAAQSVGMSNSAFNQMSTQTGALLKDTGLNVDQVSQSTITLTQRAADMASVFNTDVSDAMSAINQALRGETEAIRRYAGDVTDATLETYLLSQGIAGSVTEMSQAEKRLYRMELILKQTSDTAGDFANTSNSLANTQRILAAEAENTAAVLGEVLAPIKEKLLASIAPLLVATKKWIEQNPELTKTIVVVTAATAALVTVVGALGLAMLALMSPITGVVLVIGSVVAAVIAVKNHFSNLHWSLQIILFPLKAFMEGLNQLWATIQKIGAAIGWLAQKIGIDLQNSMQLNNSAFYEAQQATFDWMNPMPSQISTIGAMSNSIAGMGNSASDTADKIKALKEEAGGIFGDSQTEAADYNRRVAEEIIAQEQSITDKKKELRRLNRDEDSDANATRARALVKLIAEEEAALRTANDMRSNLTVELLEAERRAELTEFERTMEDMKRERIARLQEQIARLQEIQKEIAAEEVKHTAIASSFGNAQDKMQTAVKETADVAVEEANRMKSAFDRAVSSMSGLNFGGSRSLAPSISRSIMSVNDAVISPKGDIISTHPEDYLIATKDPQSLGGSGGGVTVNVFGDVSGTELVDKVSDALMRNINSRVRIA